MNPPESFQIRLDDELVTALQTNAEAQRLGIAEFVRRAVHFYLRLSEEKEIRRQYQRGYGETDLTELALEMKDWEEEQVWPDHESRQQSLLQTEFAQWDRLSDEALIEFENRLS